MRAPFHSGREGALQLQSLPRISIGVVIAITVAVGSAGATAQQPQNQPFRSLDGIGTNPAHPTWGSVYVALRRMASAGYGDGRDTPAGSARPSARAISNALCAQSGDRLNDVGATDFVWQWGQFLDHDISLSEAADPAESMPIAVPLGDAWFDPFGTGTAVIDLHRSIYVHSRTGVREQVNELTAYIDGSQIYGSSVARSQDLRAADGLMLTSAGNLLPLDATGFFVAGDIRVNEQVGLTAMHTLFVREHNRIATVLRAIGFDAERSWLFARAIVGAELQAITYREFLPVLIGRDALRPYTGYRASVDPGISNEFANAAYRLGHSMLSPTLLRLDATGDPIAAGNLALRDAFFAPGEIVSHGIDPILRGLAAQQAQELDTLIIDDVRNFLFGSPGAGGFDLASLNVQRGRDHGLASYAETRRAYGLRVPRRFADITEDRSLQDNLRTTYGTVDSIDLWIGGLAEDHVRGAMVGPLLQRVLADQFERLRDGDPYWYQRSLPVEVVLYVESMTLARIIRANTGIGDELPNSVFGGSRRDHGRIGQQGPRSQPGNGPVRTLQGRALELARQIR